MFSSCFVDFSFESAKNVGKKRRHFSKRMGRELFEDAHEGSAAYLAAEKINYANSRELSCLDDNGTPVGSKVDIWAAA